ncbi:MAG: twitching motility protein PilT [Candidatus Thermoplasmatota archaeon]|nr:twitching motility protein PilT [Candidatus Thermoplasmatota archaeon]MCL5963570.1 twitching motility protein PilT [Candidatus Thermoplasmatota archaeon]
MTVNVVIDTNALLIPFRFGINVDKELQRIYGSATIYIPSSVIDEIQKIDITDNERKSAIALSHKYKIVNTINKGDRGVIEAANFVNGVIFTNDRNLMRTALKMKISVVFMRKKNHLELHGNDLLEW